jgi:hypothetical protein
MQFQTFSLAQAFTPVVRIVPKFFLFTQAPSGARAISPLKGLNRKKGSGEFVSPGVNAWASEKTGCGYAALSKK